jgi:predicted HD phosphohydrolase
MCTLGDGLPNQIDLVRKIQDQFKSLRGLPNVIVEPQITIMEHEIQAATRALASGDVVQMLRSYEAVKSY